VLPFANFLVVLLVPEGRSSKVITVTGTDKALSEMTSDELSAIIANHRHIIRTHRYSNSSHLSYLESRIEACQLELALRK
jgi:adenosine/AMP kinase